MKIRPSTLNLMGVLLLLSSYLSPLPLVLAQAVDSSVTMTSSTEPPSSSVTEPTGQLEPSTSSDSSLEPSSSDPSTIEPSSEPSSSTEPSLTEPSSTPKPSSPSSTNPSSSEPSEAKEETEEETESSGNQPIYRLYNPGTGKHLYTTDDNERKVLYEQHGWGYEGIGWYAPRKGVAVYRLYNPVLKNHLYTTDTNEVRVLTSHHGWKADNNGRPVFASGGTVNIYRLYNARLSGRHHWTTDTNEYNVLPSHGWRQEGVKFLAAQVGKPIRTQYYGIFPSSSLRYVDEASLAYQRHLENLVLYRLAYPNGVNLPRSVYDMHNHLMLYQSANALMFAYYDLDGNGVEELIIRRTVGHGYQHDVYTYSRGKIVYLTKGLNHFHGSVDPLYTDGTFRTSNWPGPGSNMQYRYYKLSGHTITATSSQTLGKSVLNYQVYWQKIESGYGATNFRKVNLAGNSWLSGADVLNVYENIQIAKKGELLYGYTRSNMNVSISGNHATLTFKKIVAIGGIYKIDLIKHPTYIEMRTMIGVNPTPHVERYSRSDFSQLP